MAPASPPPSTDSHSWTPPRRSPWPLRLLVLTLCAGAFAFLLFTPFGQRAGRGLSRRLFPPVETAKGDTSPRIIVQEKIVEKRVEVPVSVPGPPPALPSGPSLNRTSGDLTTLFSGIGLKTELLPSEGETATEERASESAYTIEMSVKVRVPKPATTLAQLRPLNPALGTILPGLPKMLEKGKVSGFFHHLYDLKTKTISSNLKRLDRLPTRHNFYDLDAMMELEHPDTRQKVLLMQADMDVVSDGSDGDRMPSFDDYIFKSAHFQPSTSYAWPKKTNQPNPVIAMLEEELREGREKLKSPSLPKDAKTVLTARLDAIPGIVADLKRRSFLIGQEDPFIVIPLSLRNYKGRNAWAPAIGDYAVVIHGNQLLPAVIGDYGPTIKVGEASLRIARQIDPAASPYRRPVSDLKVTYLIFPDSADPDRKAPDYTAWRTRCQELVGKMGGLADGLSLHTWEDRLTPPPPPSATVSSGPQTTAPATPPGTSSENSPQGSPQPLDSPSTSAAAAGASPETPGSQGTPSGSQPSSTPASQAPSGSGAPSAAPGTPSKGSTKGSKPAS